MPKETREELNKKYKRQHKIRKILYDCGLLIAMIWVIAPMVLFVVGSLHLASFEKTILTFLVWISYMILVLLWKD